jgi:hypothetical protein
MDTNIQIPLTGASWLSHHKRASAGQLKAAREKKFIATYSFDNNVPIPGCCNVVDQPKSTRGKGKGRYREIPRREGSGGLNK